MHLIFPMRLTCASCLLALIPVIGMGQPTQGGPSFGGTPSQLLLAQTGPDGVPLPDQAFSDLMTALLGAISGDDHGDATTPAPVSQTLQALGGWTVALENIPAAMLIDLLLPTPGTKP